jgi:hypothetical protein
MEDMAKLRAKIEADYTSAFETKKRTLMDEIHCLKLSCEDKDKTVKELRKEVDAQKNTRQAERQALRKKDAEIEMLTTQNVENEIQLRAAQQISINDAAKSTEIADLKVQLQHKIDQLRAKEKDYDYLQLERKTDLEKLTELQGKQKDWQTEVSTNKREVETLRTEAHRTAAETKRLRTTLEEAETLGSALKKETRRLQSECDQSRTLEKRIYDAEAAFAVERGELQREIMELQLAKDESNESARSAQKTAVDEIQRAADVSRSQIENIRHQLKQAEAKNREMEAAHQRQIQYHRENMEARYRLLVKEVEHAPQGRQRAAQSVVALGTPAQTAQTAHLQQSLTEEENDDEIPPNERVFMDLRSESPQSGQKEQDLYSFFDEEFQNGYESQQILDPDAEVVIETQEVDLPRLLSAQSSRSGEQGLRSNNCTRHCHSSDLSSADSELMTQLEQAGHTQSPTLRGRDQNDDRQYVYRKSRGDMSTQSKDVFNLDSQSPFSQDRPKSQANTASRMMPPQGTISQTFSPRVHAVDTTAGKKARLLVQEKSGDSLRGDRGSSVTSENNRTTASNHAASHQSSQLVHQSGQDGDILPETPSDLRRKRRDVRHQHEHGMSPKKSRMLPMKSPAIQINSSMSPSNRVGNGRSSLLSLPRSQTEATPRRTSARLTKSKGKRHYLLIQITLLTWQSYVQQEPPVRVRTAVQPGTRWSLSDREHCIIFRNTRIKKIL